MLPISLFQRDPTAAWAISRTVALEGGWVDHVADPGGATKFGVCLRSALASVSLHPELRTILDVDHDGDVDRDDIKGLSQDQAEDWYYETVWTPGRYGALAPPSELAWKVFDIAVNTGPKRAGLIVQAAVNDVAGRPTLTLDGVLGQGSRDALRSLSNRPELLTAIRAQQLAFYRRLVAQEPKLAVFADGWARRAAA